MNKRNPATEMEAAWLRDQPGKPLPEHICGLDDAAYAEWNRWMAERYGVCERMPARDTADMKIRATARRAVWHMFGQLPRNATQREREARKRLEATFEIIRQDRNGKTLPRRDVDLAYRRFNAALARQHPDIDTPKWRRG